MWNFKRREKWLLLFLAIFFALYLLRHIHSIWEKENIRRLKFRPLETAGVAIREWTPSEYVLIVSSHNKSVKTSVEKVFDQLKVPFRVKQLGALSLKRPLPFLVVFTDSTIVNFMKDGSHDASRTIISTNKIPIVSFCTDAGKCRFNSHAILNSLGYYKSIVRTRASEIINVLKHNREYSLSRSALTFAVPSQAEFKSLLSVDRYRVDFNKLAPIVAESTKDDEISIAYYDSGVSDGFEKVVIGGDLGDWVVSVLFVDALSFFAGDKLSFGLQRIVQVDIDDVFLPAKSFENSFRKSDVDAMIEFQHHVRNIVPGFQFNLGFCGSFLSRGRYPEETSAFKYLIARRDKFMWFPHMYRHYQPHNLTFAKLRDEMVENKKFAATQGIKVSSSYAVAPHHSGVYPVVDNLFQLWKDIWNVTVTSTEEYPRLKSTSGHKGFVYKDISVLPRQTCGLFTHTVRSKLYPGGIDDLYSRVSGGSIFGSVLFNPVVIFMTHIGNYGADRLALKTFSKLFSFISENTNLKLYSATPTEMAKYHFSVFPDQVLPLWTSPCADDRHLKILPKNYSCAVLPQVIIIGPQKSGTTAFQFFLSAHPDFATSHRSIKSFEEVQFFDNDNHYIQGIEWYKSMFPKINRKTQVNFEKSASYFDKIKVPLRIHEMLPKVKLVIILRNPVARAYSWYLHEISKGNYPGLSFNNAISVTSPYPELRNKILSPGLYHKHIKRWLEVFPLSSFHFVDGDNFLAKPTTELELFISEFKPELKYNFSSIIEFNTEKQLHCFKKGVNEKTCLGESKGRTLNSAKMSAVDERLLVDYYRSDAEQLRNFFINRKLRIPSWTDYIITGNSSTI